MEINRDLILKLESLAQLELTESERLHMQADLQNILQMVNKLQEIDTGGLEPLVHLGTTQVALREDVAGNPLTTAQALQNARVKDDQFFLVPKVIEQ
jgi:aspartyl-tRNA(Asn)/glutamyl-tRNA(Gln) amidotransferase subunit C